MTKKYLLSLYESSEDSSFGNPKWDVYQEWFLPDLEEEANVLERVESLICIGLPNIGIEYILQEPAKYDDEETKD